MIPSDIEVAPLPVPPDTRTLVVFGGTFDPPHRGHIELPPLARDAIHADWLVYVPAARNPLKPGGPEAPDDARIDMLRAALRGTPRTSISTIELDQKDHPSYTVETLRTLRRDLPSATSLRLLIGADQARNFHRWREPAEIITLAEPLVMLRAPVESSTDLIRELTPHWDAPMLSRWKSWVVEVPMIPINATRLRAILREQGVSAPELQESLPQGVLEVIRSRGLYARQS